MISGGVPLAAEIVAMTLGSALFMASGAVEIRHNGHERNFVEFIVSMLSLFVINQWRPSPLARLEKNP